MAIIVVTVIGLVGAVILVAASIFMYVPVDERVAAPAAPTTPSAWWKRARP